MNALIQEQVRIEVEDLHAFFCLWFAGKLPKTDFGSKFSSRFAEDLVFIPPVGKLLGLEELSTLIYKGYASNPEFRIQIREVSIEKVFGDYYLATYEEWQRNALASTPPDNGRIATVVFKSGDPLQWVHIHETWLPETIIATGDYNF